MLNFKHSEKVYFAECKKIHLAKALFADFAEYFLATRLVATFSRSVIGVSLKKIEPQETHLKVIRLNNSQLNMVATLAKKKHGSNVIPKYLDQYNHATRA